IDLLHTYNRCVCLCLTEPQTVRLFQTLVSGDGGLPEYSCALMLDDVEMYHYDSNSHRIISRIPSVQEAVGKQRIRIYVERLKANHMIVKENMLYMMKRRNISSGVHYGQAVYGCEVREDGTRVGQITIAFDGKDFLSFDKNDLRWISAVPEAQTLRRKLDNDRDRNQVWKQDLEYDCPTWIEEFYPYSKSTFERQSKCVALLSCLVTGFYPRPIEVTWTRDGNTVHEVESSGVLPNHDHTFQTVKQMELETGSVGEQGFSCLVEHSSLQGVLEVPWGKINNNNSGLHSNLTRGSTVVAVSSATDGGAEGMRYKQEAGANRAEGAGGGVRSRKSWETKEVPGTCRRV
uniref:Class I histocompatibility antigen, F10 alpha chain-like n=1 Tax=Callorhinchus milii TaxID=7868 RepID=A0A4W3GI23_CALMI